MAEGKWQEQDPVDGTAFRFFSQESIFFFKNLIDSNEDEEYGSSSRDVTRKLSTVFWIPSTNLSAVAAGGRGPGFHENMLEHSPEFRIVAWVKQSKQNKKKMNGTVHQGGINESSCQRK